MLFKTSAQLIEYAEVVAGDFFAMKATLLAAEEAILPNILGNTIYNNLNTAVANATNEADLSESDKKLLHKCRKVLGPYFAYRYAPKTAIKVGTIGAVRHDSATQKSAFQDQITNYLQANMQECEEAIEALYAYLENNVPAWSNTDEFKAYKKLFITTGKEFNDNFNCESPYKNFIAMRGKMYDVEQLYIKKEIGETVFAQLKNKHLTVNPTYTDKEKELLVMIKKAIANLTVAMSLPYLNVRIDGNGLSVINLFNTSTNDKDKTRTNATADDINILARTAADAGNAWLMEATNFINNNKIDFGLPLIVEEKVTPIETRSAFGLV